MFDIDFILANTATKREKVNQIYLDRQHITFEVYAARQEERIRKDFENLANLITTGGTIRKAEYADLKYSLDKAVSDCYDNYVQVMFKMLPGMLEQDRPYNMLKITRNISYELHISGVLNVAAVGKKIAKLKMNEANDTDKQFIALVQKMVDVFLPVQRAIETLKKEDRIVKGRALRAEPIPENPNKDVKTCPCCLGSYAVMGGKEAKGSLAGKMVHHGFKRPGTGEQTSSCYGIRFQPLEVTTEGLVWYIENLDKQIETLKNGIKTAPRLTKINNPKYSYHAATAAKRKGIEYKEPLTIYKEKTDAVYWKRQIEIIIANLEAELRFKQNDRDMRQKIVDNWKPGRAVYIK
jgi:hypothetical protein